MQTPNGDDRVDLHSRNQGLLSELLSTDLKLVVTFMDFAGVTHDPDHQRAIRRHIAVALESIRRLSRWVEDPGARPGFAERADELEKKWTASR